MYRIVAVVVVGKCGFVYVFASIYDTIHARDERLRGLAETHIHKHKQLLPKRTLT